MPSIPVVRYGGKIEDAVENYTLHASRRVRQHEHS